MKPNPERKTKLNLTRFWVCMTLLCLIWSIWGIDNSGFDGGFFMGLAFASAIACVYCIQESKENNDDET